VYSLTAWNVDSIKLICVLYVYDKCLKFRREYWQSFFEYRVLRKILGSKKDVVWQRLSNEKFHDLFSSPNAMKAVISKL